MNSNHEIGRISIRKNCSKSAPLSGGDIVLSLLLCKVFVLELEFHEIIRPGDEPIMEVPNHFQSHFCEIAPVEIPNMTSESRSDMGNASFPPNDEWAIVLYKPIHRVVDPVAMKRIHLNSNILPIAAGLCGRMGDEIFCIKNNKGRKETEENEGECEWNESGAIVPWSPSVRRAEVGKEEEESDVMMEEDNGEAAAAPVVLQPTNPPTSINFGLNCQRGESPFLPSLSSAFYYNTPSILWLTEADALSKPTHLAVS